MRIKGAGEERKEAKFGKDDTTTITIETRLLRVKAKA